MCFFIIVNVVDVKLEIDIVEKCFFVVKEKIIYYICFFIMIML